MGEVKNLGLILIKLENIENLLIQNGSKKVYRIAIIFTYFRWTQVDYTTNLLFVSLKLQCEMENTMLHSLIYMLSGAKQRPKLSRAKQQI